MKHILLKNYQGIIIIFVLFLFIGWFGILSNSSLIQSQDARREHNCINRLKILVLMQNEYFTGISTSQEIVSDPLNGRPITLILKQDDYIEDYETGYCFADVELSDKEKKSNYIQSFTIFAIPVPRVDNRIFLGLFKANQESKLRTFAINQNNEVFVKLGDPKNLTCENIRLHSPDEWGKVVTD